MKGLWLGLKRVWEAWKFIGRKIGNFQARILLTILYGVAVLPFGLLVRMFADPLRIKYPRARWLDRPGEANDIQWARRQ